MEDSLLQVWVSRLRDVTPQVVFTAANYYRIANGDERMSGILAYFGTRKHFLRFLFFTNHYLGF